MLIKVVDDVHGGMLAKSDAVQSRAPLYRYSTGSLISKKKMHVCAEFTCLWQLE
jgi:hypothetical protein